MWRRRGRVRRVVEGKVSGDRGLILGVGMGRCFMGQVIFLLIRYGWLGNGRLADMIRLLRFLRFELYDVLGEWYAELMRWGEAGWLNIYTLGNLCQVHPWLQQGGKVRGLVHRGGKG